MRLMASIVHAVTRAISDHGIAAVLLLMTLESACIPIPSEVIQLFAGYLVSQHRMAFAAAVAAGVGGNLLGSSLAWWAGHAGGRPLVLRYGRFVHVTPERLELAERWFARRGERAVLIGRCVPLVRTFISLPAGIARMPFWQFTVYTVLGCIPWVIALALAGVWAGNAWEKWHARLEYLDYLVAAGIIAGVAYLVVHSRRRRMA
jgi:membrane protein DedA with SNARE-associated domain